MSATKSSKSATTRTRNFATVVYPDSCPPDWIERLIQTHIPCFISPLHDKDVNPDGEIKKPHYHVLIMYDGPKTLEQAQEIFDLICGVGHEYINTIRGYARYLCHLDNPEKYQYSVDDVRQLNGADYNEIIGLASDKYKAIREMISYCDVEHITSFADLMIYAMNERNDWFRCLCDNGTYVVKEYLKSRKWTKKYELLKSLNHDVIHEDTGEIVNVPTGFDALNDDIEF